MASAPVAPAPVAGVRPRGEDVHKAAAALREQIARRIVGLEDVVEQVLIAVLTEHHVLLEGVPGLAKTLLVSTIADLLDLSFRRIQFTPDLMPADVTGTSVFHPGEGAFRFQPGPVFAHVLLCDEINRAPAKTQSALLEAMQEGWVTSDGRRHPLPQPFTVFATQNPIEHEGTYPLPEAQLDRFLFKVVIGYPAADVEARLLSESHARDEFSSPADLGVAAVSSPDDLLRLRAEVRGVAVREDLPGYVVRLLDATRKAGQLVLGASPRAGVMLLRAAKARAAIGARDFVLPDDVKAVFLPALRHRVVLDPAEEIEGTTADDALRRILDSVEVPR